MRVIKSNIEKAELRDGSIQDVQHVILTVEGAKDGDYPPDYRLPKTGDETPLLLWMLLAAASFTAFIMLRMYRRDSSD